ncbi:MAG: hypothetical protein OQK82_06820, partial [Candidatus Pacearchaeota archaeon]|nr:hypothetical protein [Candidatus Pacearchaeota archaeon]
VSFFYKDLNSTNTMRTLYKTIIKDKRLQNKDIFKFIKNIDYHWLISEKRNAGLYGYRADIYHNVSKICRSGSQTNFKQGSVELKLIIDIPDELLKLKNKEKIEIEDFVELLWKDYKKYILDLFDVIESDYKII